MKRSINTLIENPQSFGCKPILDVKFKGRIRT